MTRSPGTTVPAGRAAPLVLVVDDHAGVRETFSMLLGDECELVGAGDGHAAIQILRARAVDLVLLDLMMPGMSGWEVLAHIQHLGGLAQVIVVSAIDTAASGMEAMRRGAWD